jgi:predicted RND superfamily exporter protein
VSRPARSLSETVAGRLYRWRRWLTGLILAGAVLLAPLSNFTAIDNELTSWFDADDPAYQQYERLRDEFGGTRTLIVAIQAPSRDRLLSDEGFRYLDDLTAAIDRVAVVERVVSLATATVVDARPSDDPAEPAWLDVRALFDDLDAATPAEVGRRAIDDELLRGDLISADGTVAAVIVFFDESRVDDVRARTLDEIRTLVEGGRPEGFAAHYNGSIEISETYTRVTLDNQLKLTPPILLLTMLALYVMFRSWRITLLTMFSVLVSLVWTLGIYNLLGFSYNVLSSIIVPMTVVLAVADDVHIIQHFGESRRTRTAEQAFIATVSHLFAPILGATATTALGMASLGTSQVTAVREFGFGSAIGVSMDFVISMTLVPTMLSWLTPGVRMAPQEAWFTGPLLAVSRFSVRRAGLVAVVAGVAITWAALGLGRIRVDTNHINFFAADHPLTRSARVIDDRLSGIYTYQVLLEGPPESLRQPDILRRMDALEDHLRGLAYARKVTGLVDYVKRVHRELGDGTGERGVPDDPSLVSQELFVFTLADQGRIELEQVAASDYSKAQITVKQASMSSDLLYEQMQHVQQTASEAFAGTPVRATVTGSGHLFATLDTYLVRSQITSFTTAFVTVFGVIFLVFRSWRFGLLAIVPNLFPVLAVFGVMGWFDISLNVATVMLASVALGVVDDDTVHFISRYRRETARGRSAPQAIEAATIYEGRAALTAALVNSSAFAVLALSAYKPTAWFGGLLALTMIVAFLAEVFILPATITLAPRLFGPERVHARRPAPVAGAGGGV